LDKHGGINSSESEAQSLYQSSNKISGNVNGMGTGSGARSAFPSRVSNEIKQFKLADVAIVKTYTASTSKPLEPHTKKINRTATAAVAAAAAVANAGASSQLRRKPDPTAFQAPEGTHAKRKKRPSRLKRIYRRTKAEGAVQHWLGVLSAVEEALQIVGELHGALINETQALKQREQEDFSANVAQEEKNRRNISFAQALREGGGAQKLHRDLKEPVFAPSAQLQGLQEHVRLTCERVEQLGCIYATARANLIRSQEQLLAAQGGGGGGGKASLLRTLPISEAAIKETPGRSITTANINTHGLAVETTRVVEESPTQRARALSHSTDALPPPSSSPVPPSTTVENPKQPVVASTATSSQESQDGGSSASASSRSNSSSSSSTSSGSSGSDFGLQWGDTLRTWATNVGVDARTSLQQQQRQQKHGNKKKNEDGRNELAREKRVVEPATVKEEVKIVPSRILKLDGEVSVPLPAIVDATTTPPPAETTPLPTATDALRNWLEGAADGDTQVETLSPSFSMATTLDQINLNETQAAPIPAALSFPVAETLNPSPPFHCDACNITARGLKPWQDHLSSRRHVSKVAHQAANTTSESQQHQPEFSIMTSTSPHLPTSRNKCYTGPSADVEPYVTHIITPELNDATTALLKQLLEWQERTRRLDPVNFKRKRRLISGMREVEKAVKMSKAKLLIVAPNIGPVPTTRHHETESDAARHDTSNNNNNNNPNPNPLSSSPFLSISSTYPIQAALDMAKDRKIPTIFALTRQRMGKILGARKTASAFVVLDASGAEKLLATVLEIAGNVDG
jgi:ribosomal protein L7Ae-like RNA K-turn-binding protein